MKHGLFASIALKGALWTVVSERRTVDIGRQLLKNNRVNLNRRFGNIVILLQICACSNQIWCIVQSIYIYLPTNNRSRSCQRNVGNVGNCFRAHNHVQRQKTNHQKLLALSSLDEGFN